MAASGLGRGASVALAADGVNRVFGREKGRSGWKFGQRVWYGRAWRRVPARLFGNLRGFRSAGSRLRFGLVSGEECGAGPVEVEPNERRPGPPQYGKTGIR